MSDTLDQVLGCIEGALSSADVFAEVGIDPEGRWRNWRLMCHPDRFHGEEALRERVSEAFKKLTELWNEWITSTRSTLPKAIGWNIVSQFRKGGICDLFLVSDEEHERVVLKTNRNALDNGLLEREVEVLKYLSNSVGKNHIMRDYFPTVVDSFLVADVRANVLSYDDEAIALDSLLTLMPDLDFRHSVWMMNRILEFLVFIHRQQVIHGAILPNHLLYYPSSHRLMLVDWTASNKFPNKDGKIPYLVSRWGDWYPPEVRKGDVYPATDIYMAARCFLSHRTPNRFRHLLEWATADSPHSRPQDALDLLDRWRKAAQEEYGPPKFVQLNLPTS